MIAPRTATLVTILSGSLAIVAWDVVLTMNAEEGDTISSVLNIHSTWAGPTAGYICGHLFSPTKTTSTPTLLKVGGGVFCVLLGVLSGNGFVAFLLSVLVGAVCWPNMGRLGP